MSDKPTKTQKPETEPPDAPPAAKAVKQPNKEKFFLVKFHDRSDPQQQLNVELIVNGDTLVIQRGVEVPIPGRFRECADHATYPVYKQEPGQMRKVTGYIRVFPYDFIRECTEQEYLDARKKGTAATRAALEKATTVEAPK